MRPSDHLGLVITLRASSSNHETVVKASQKILNLQSTLLPPPSRHNQKGSLKRKIQLLTNSFQAAHQTDKGTCNKMNKQEARDTLIAGRTSGVVKKKKNIDEKTSVAFEKYMGTPHENTKTTRHQERLNRTFQYSKSVSDTCGSINQQISNNNDDNETTDSSGDVIDLT